MIKNISTAAICVIAITLFISAGYYKPQSPISNDEIIHKKLSWKDFKGPIEKKYDYFAMTYWNVAISFNAKSAGNKLEVDTKVQYALKDNSWYKPDKISDQLLNHEQGHLDIAYLFALELRNTCKSFNFDRKKIKAQIDSIYSALEKKYIEKELLYDKETNHMHNELQQKKWDDFFKQEAEKLNKGRIED